MPCMRCRLISAVRLRLKALPPPTFKRSIRFWALLLKNRLCQPLIGCGQSGTLITNIRDFFFQRQAQVFPDVLLKSDLNGQEIILGIELKGWYLLAKERVPNFRFTTTADACAEADLIVVMPWNLSNVLSGAPVTHKPYVAQAKYAAEYRNYWWTEVRSTRSDTDIISPADVEPYPSTGTQVADRPVSDGGNNFGRLARTGLMDDYIEQMLDLRLSGIPAGEWINFLRRFEQ